MARRGRTHAPGVDAPQSDVEHGAAGARPHPETASGRRQQVAELQLLQPDSADSPGAVLASSRARDGPMSTRAPLREMPSAGVATVSCAVAER